MSLSYSEEYQLKDAIAFIRRAWLWLLGFGLLGLLVGGIYSTLRPQYYEASGRIELAKYSPYELYPDLDNQRYVNAPKATVDFIKSANFFDGDTGGKCGLNVGEKGASVISQRMRVFVVKDTSYIGVTFKATSEVAAKECIEAIFRKIEPLQLEHLRQWDAYTEKKVLGLEAELTARQAAIQQLKTTLGVIVVRINPNIASPLLQINTPTGPKVLFMDMDANHDLLKEKVETFRHYLATPGPRKPNLSAVEVSSAKNFPPTGILLMIAFAAGLGMGCLSFVVRDKFLRKSA